MGENIVKICPKCGKLSLEINLEKGIARCKKCGYEKRMITWNKKSPELRE